MVLGSLYFPHFFFQVEARDNPSLSDKPFVICLPSPSKPVMDVSPRAQRYGITPLMPLREAKSLCPNLLDILFEKAKYEEVFGSLLEILSTISPSLEGIPFSFILIDLTHEREKKGFMRKAIEIVRERKFLKAKGGIASNRFVARLASMLSEELLLVKEGEEALFLKNLPIDYLPCDEEVKERLKLFGMRKMEDMRKIPLTSLLLQFGKKARELSLLAMGIDGAWINPWKGKREEKKEICFENPLTTIDEILLWTERLIQGSQEEKVYLPTKVTFLFKTSHEVFKKTFFLREEDHLKEAILFKLRSFLERRGIEGSVREMTILFSDYKRKEGVKMDLFTGWIEGSGLFSAIREIERRYGREKIRYEAFETVHLC